MSINDPANSDARVMPVRQQRSMARQQAILQAGRNLLQKVPFDTLRMEQIATEANCSVGTLYQRFKDKDALLDVILEEVVAEMEDLVTEELLPPRFKNLSAQVGVWHVVSVAHGFLHANQGLLRAITARQLRQPDAISVLQKAGARVVKVSFESLSECSDEFRRTVEKRTYQFALQMVIGTLNNAIINRPGPYQIGESAIVDQLSLAVCRITGLPVSQP